MEKSEVPSSWGGRHFKNQPHQDISKISEKFNEDINNWIFNSGHTKIIPSGSKEQFNKTINYLMKINKELNELGYRTSRSIIVLSSNASMNLSPHINRALVDGGIIIIKGETQDALESAKIYFKQYIQMRDKARANLEIFMNNEK